MEGKKEKETLVSGGLWLDEEYREEKTRGSPKHFLKLVAS